MSPDRPLFPQYGEGGDHVGAKRSRRAFRLFVFIVAAFAVLLAFSELYLQHEGAERLYMLALTKHPESARVFLQQAVRRDEQTHEAPTPKYLMALASREEADQVLPTYERAFRLDPRNPALALRYGSQLALAGEYAEAEAKFRIAEAADPSNALPMYLQASVHPFVRSDEEGLSESLTSVAVANNSGKPVVFPRPLWFSGLPQHGQAYAQLGREIVDECSLPIARYAGFVIGLAQRDIDRDRVLYWDSWLQTLQQTGEHIASSALAPRAGGADAWAGAARQAAVGIDIQLRTIEQRLRISRFRGGPGNPELETRRAALEAARERIYTFENDMGARMEADRRGYVFALRLLADTLVWLVLVYLAFRIAWWRLRRRRSGNPPAASPVTDTNSPDAAGPEPERLRVSGGTEPERTIRHSWAGKGVLTVGAVLLLTTLFVVTALQRGSASESAWIPAISALWWTEVALLLAFGLAYPFLALPAPRRAAERNAASDPEDLLPEARRLFRGAALCLAHRYYGILLGAFWVAVSLWVVGFRMGTGLYPWQLPLLTTGLIEEEMEAVRQALALLT